MTIRLSDREVEAIREHGRESYRDEACGVMLGRVHGELKDVLSVAPLVNSRKDERHRRFVVTPEDYRRAEAEAASRRLTLVGFYHSHPDHPAYPSSYDLEHAFPYFSYVIVSVRNGEPGQLRSFVLADDRSRFFEEEMSIDNAEP